MIGTLLLALSLAFPVVRRDQRPPDFDLYHRMYNELESSGYERSCVTGQLRDFSAQQREMHRVYRKRLARVDDAIEGKYPVQLANDPPIGGLAQPMDCKRRRSAAKRFIAALAALEHHLGVR